MVLPTLTGTPISGEAREACADVGGPSSVHTLGTLRNVTVVCAPLAVVYHILHSCKVHVKERRWKSELSFIKSKPPNKFIWENICERLQDRKETRNWGGFPLGVGIFFFFLKSPLSVVLNLINVLQWSDCLSTSQVLVNIDWGRKATIVTDPNIHISFAYEKESWMKKCKASHRATSHVS